MSVARMLTAMVIVVATATPALAGQHQHPTAPETPPLFPHRETSGTAWVPDETPMFGLMRQAGAWQLMVHGSLFGQILYESGNRHRTGGFSSNQVSSVNWAMFMARRRTGAGRIGLRVMASAEPWTVGDCGFINLLANGEMCEGDTIHDRQHPHDLVMELAVEYDRPLRGALRLQTYAALAGEPALGPAGFPHRLSAMPNPIAPITHHWLDSSHITFGLITAGVYSNRWKLEGSVFNGREPDARRANLDLAGLDSMSGRLSFLPTSRLAVQVSAGHLHGAEAEFAPAPRSDVERATTSVTYLRAFGSDKTIGSTVAYGVNASREVIPGRSVYLVTHAVLAEASLMIRDRHTWFGRMEMVGKPGHDLHVHELPDSVFAVGKLEAGYTRHFRPWRGLVPGVGGVASVNVVPTPLAPRYSGHVAFGAGVFFVIRPNRHADSGKAQ